MSRQKTAGKNRSLVIGVVCGIGCALCVALYIAGVNEQANAAQAQMLAEYGGDQIEVCVAKRDIAAGETLRDSDIEIKTWIATLLPADAVMARGDAVGKQAGSAILAGEVISSRRFGFEAADIEIPGGFTALSVPAKEVQAVGGALKPGMRCDVYAVGGSSTSRLASDVLILTTSVAGDSASSSAITWVTLAVQPSQVEEMVSAAQNLSLYFVLPSSENSDVDVGAKTSDSENSAVDGIPGFQSAESSDSTPISVSILDGLTAAKSSDISGGAAMDAE